jgi:predicted transcriptional regulator
MVIMTRLNITLSDEIAKQLAEKRNKSRFIAEALEEKFEREKRKKIERLLREGYKASSKEDKKLDVDWEKAGLEKWD